MLGLDWSYYSCLPPSQVIPSFAPTPTAPTPAVPARNYVDQDGPSDLSPVPFNGSSIEAVYPSPDALIGFPHRIQRVTRARKSASSTTRSARHTLPSSTSPSLSTPTTSFSSASSIKTYKPRRALGTGTPNFTSTTPCDTSYLCTTCHATYPLTRSSDFTRHVLTHYPEYRGGALLCCGVPLDSPQYLAMMAEGMIPPDAPVRRYYGRWMVGGCGLLCARTDVLRKHLGNGRKGCVGDLTGDWHPPKLPRAGS
ncbi:hypothetical protein BC629DRAFT_156117 [Irpex lacteus]|nr:hypothetical protein BC629DRAFT_156117 [Irpex lacteus]